TTVEDGATVTVTGEGYPADTEVTVQLVDSAGNPVGDPVNVTTDADGAFTAEVTVPEGTEAGDYAVDAATEAGETASADLTVTNGDDNTGDDATTEPTVTVDPDTAAPGDSITVEGENFPPNSEVEVQLTDSDGNPVGDPVTVTTDDEGSFSEELVLLDGTLPGDYTIVATAEIGRAHV